MRNFEVGEDAVIFEVKEDDTAVFALLVPQATGDLPTYSDYPVGSLIVDTTTKKLLVRGNAGWETVSSS